MKNYANKLDTLSRRGFMADAAKAFFGVTIGGSLAQMYAANPEAAGTVVSGPGFGKAKSVIYLYMSGSTINIISLSSLSIAIGMVVDDAVIIVDNYMQSSNEHVYAITQKPANSGLRRPSHGSRVSGDKRKIGDGVKGPGFISRRPKVEKSINPGIIIHCLSVYYTLRKHALASEE